MKLKALIAFCLAIVSLSGCGPSQAEKIGSEVNVSGTVTAGGKPVGNVVLKLQPLEQGYEKIIPLAADGKFTVQTQPGKYAYYFVPKEGTKAVPASAASYAQASLERTVVVANGQSLDIDLK